MRLKAPIVLFGVAYWETNEIPAPFKCPEVVPIPDLVEQMRFVYSEFAASKFETTLPPGSWRAVK
jgi:hypothetical protein